LEKQFKIKKPSKNQQIFMKELAKNQWFFAGSLTFLKFWGNRLHSKIKHFLGKWIYIPGMITRVHDGLCRGAGDVLPVHLLSWMDDFGFVGWLANSSLSSVTDMSVAEQSKAQNDRLSRRRRKPCRIFSCQIRWTITRYSSLFWTRILDWGSFFFLTHRNILPLFPSPAPGNYWRV
jgi:hypothetical protein